MTGPPFAAAMLSSLDFSSRGASQRRAQSALVRHEVVKRAFLPQPDGFPGTAVDDPPARDGLRAVFLAGTRRPNGGGTARVAVDGGRPSPG